MAGPGGRLVIAGFILGAILRVALLLQPGSPDIQSWKAWSFAASTGATSVYGVGGSPPERRVIHWRGVNATVEYPPLAIYELGMAGRVYAAIDPGYTDSRTLTALVKLPGVVAEMAVVFVLVVWGRRVFGARAAIWAAMAIWINPVVLVNGAGLGYLDSQVAAPAVLALVAAAARQPALAGALTAAAVLTKAQALLVAPVILFAAVDLGFRLAPSGGAARRNPAAFLVGGLVAAGALVLPIILRGAWPNLLHATGRLPAPDVLPGAALNAWWLINRAVRASESFEAPWFKTVRTWWRRGLTEIGFPDPQVMGLAVVAVLVSWALWRSTRGRTPGGWAALAGWCAFAYFMFGAPAHVTHLCLALPFFALAAGLERRFHEPFYALSAIGTANLFLIYGIGSGRPLIPDRVWPDVELTLVLTLINFAAFVWITAETMGPGPEARNWDVEEND